MKGNMPGLPSPEKLAAGHDRAVRLGYIARHSRADHKFEVPSFVVDNTKFMVRALTRHHQRSNMIGYRTHYARGASVRAHASNFTPDDEFHADLGALRPSNTGKHRPGRGGCTVKSASLYLVTGSGVVSVSHGDSWIRSLSSNEVGGTVLTFASCGDIDPWAGAALVPNRSYGVQGDAWAPYLARRAAMSPSPQALGPDGIIAEDFHCASLSVGGGSDELAHALGRVAPFSSSPPCGGFP